VNAARPDSAKLRLHGTIARHVGRDILSGRLKAGLLLRSDIEASEHLGISRTTYREAMRILSAKGLVHSQPRVGTRVNSPEKWQLLDRDILSWLFECEPNQRILDDFFELLRIVEPQVAALAAVRRTEDQLETMRRALADMRTNKLMSDARRLAAADFHGMLLQATDNVFLNTLACGLAPAMAWKAGHEKRENSASCNTLRDYEQVLRALKVKNAPKARRLMCGICARLYSPMLISMREALSIAARTDAAVDDD
jgi:DNA-binding FadR family transcriptional regulator